MVHSAIKEYFKFSKKETTHYILISFIMAFILSFKLWGGKTFDFNTGIGNLFFYFIISLMIVFVYISFQKLYGLYMGINVEYFISKVVMGVSVAVTFITNGTLWFLMLGESKLSHIASHRIGHLRYELENKEHAYIILFGNLGLVILAFIFKLFGYLPNINESVIIKIILAILAFSIFNLLPVPGTNGLIVLFASRLLYVFSFVLILLISFFLIYFGILYSLLLSLICSLIVLFLYIKFVESGLK